MSVTRVHPAEPEPHDEARWMAIAIEVVAVAGSLLFALVQAS